MAAEDEEDKDDEEELLPRVSGGYDMKEDEEDIKRMVEEAEKFKEQDRIMRDIADARNVLNDYAYVVVRECVHFDITHY